MLTADQIAFLKLIAPRNALQISREPTFQNLALRMRQACPVPGEEWDKLLTVWLEPGEEVKEHCHKRHTILYYPEAASQLVMVELTLYPGADTLIHLFPGVDHYVPPVTRRRLSVAMLVSDAPV